MGALSRKGRAEVPGQSIYAATKAAVETLMRIHARAFGPRGITVRDLRQRQRPVPDRQRYVFRRQARRIDREDRGMIPPGRLGTPEEIASAVSFLVGPDGRWVNGQVLRVNGGMV